MAAHNNSSETKLIIYFFEVMLYVPVYNLSVMLLSSADQVSCSKKQHSVYGEAY